MTAFKRVMILALMISVLLKPSTAMARPFDQTQEIYMAKHALDLRNYNWRQEVFDDPTTVLWCTFTFPDNPSAPLVTIAVAGKPTSSGKRPFPTEYKERHPTNENDTRWEWNPEKPGPDRMYGESGEYRYGFGPAGKAEYEEYFGLPTFCTTVPKTWQRLNTTLIAAADPVFQEASNRAQDAMQDGDVMQAQSILLSAATSIQQSR